MNSRFLPLNAQVVVALLLCSAAATAALAETKHSAAVAQSQSNAVQAPVVYAMGVSSAWTLNDQPTATKKFSPSPSPASAPCVASAATNSVAHQPTRTAAVKGSENQPDLEDVLNSWQKEAKNLYATAVPRSIAFWNWGMKKLGIGSSAPIPNLTAAPRSVKKISVQAISSNHPVWLLRDGRLKTVAAQ